MNVYGLTGGIASGKSAVAKFLNNRGIKVIDADQIARDVVRPGEDGLGRVAAAFGPDILLADGSLNRKELRIRIAQDAEAQALLNRIIHPLIRQRIANQLAELARAGTPFAFVEAALLLEAGSASRYDRIILVTAPKEERLKRLVSRDGMSKDLATKLMARQWTDEEKRLHADHEIVNDGSMATLEAKVDVLLAVLRRVDLK